MLIPLPLIFLSKMLRHQGVPFGFLLKRSAGYARSGVRLRTKDVPAIDYPAAPEWANWVDHRVIIWRIFLVLFRVKEPTPLGGTTRTDSNRALANTRNPVCRRTNAAARLVHVCVSQ